MCDSMEYPRLDQQCFVSSTCKECVPLCCIVTVLESFYIANALSQSSMSKDKRPVLSCMRRVQIMMMYYPRFRNSTPVGMSCLERAAGDRM